MKGFLYTLIVLIIATSFMYVIFVQNSLPPLPAEDRIAQELRESARALYGIEIYGNTINGKIGKQIRIDEFKRVISNYNAIRNAGVKVELTPRFRCGDTHMWFSGFDGSSWNTEIMHKTKMSLRTEKNAVIISKNWAWAENGIQMQLIIQNANGVTLLDEEGYINETLNNQIQLADDEGNLITITLENGELEIRGNCKFSQKIYNNCNIASEGYIERNNIRYRI
ncbi:MAG: hypothetical protein QW500_02435 [Candidatus Micrarchaeia archaeon]